LKSIHVPSLFLEGGVASGDIVPLPNFERNFTRFDAVTHLGELSASFQPNEIWVMSADPNQ
jgi:hypothetical protein